jgi:hypothetical protein
MGKVAADGSKWKLHSRGWQYWTIKRLLNTWTILIIWDFQSKNPPFANWAFLKPEASRLLKGEAGPANRVYGSSACAYRKSEIVRALRLTTHPLLGGNKLLSLIPGSFGVTNSSGVFSASREQQTHQYTWNFPDLQRSRLGDLVVMHVLLAPQLTYHLPFPVKDLSGAWFQDISSGMVNIL